MTLAQWEMATSAGGEGGNDEYQWEWLFKEERPEHIRHFIAAMEEEILFHVNLGDGVVMLHFWRLKFIISRSMNERESYMELIHITMGKFKDEAENNLGHMHSLLCLSAPPF